MAEDKKKTTKKTPREFEEDSSEDASTQQPGTSREGYQEPQKKMVRLTPQPTTTSKTVNLLFNTSLQTTNFIKWLHHAWTSKDNIMKDAIEETTGAKIFRSPFQIGILPELLDPKSGACKALVNEMIYKVEWTRKQMDLYEFYQSADLSSMTDCRLLTNFLQMLRKQVLPWLEEAVGIKMDYVSASCSMYNCGDYLLVHDDLLNDRQVAFIYYLSPWENVEKWTDAQGGRLEVFHSDEQCFPHFPVEGQIFPKNNQFVFFKVGARSFHQVGEVTNFDYPRLSINGWFHGETNAEQNVNTANPFTCLQYQPPNTSSKNLELGQLVNEVYLRQTSIESIQRSIEEKSEICLYQFLRPEIFKNAVKQLLEDDKLVWKRQEPANVHNYEVLDFNSASDTIEQVLNLFASNEMFELLSRYTDLDLFGPDAKTPSCIVELQRWSHGNYTVLGDGAYNEDSTLDLIYYLNASSGVGVITYLASDEVSTPSDNVDEVMYANTYAEVDVDVDDDVDPDSSVLLTVTPIDNALSVIYRCDSTTKFTKYVSRNTPLDRGPVFIISCSYKE